MILMHTPFERFMPIDIRSWISQNADDSNLAEVFAAVCNKTGCLMHEADGTDDPWISYAFDNWWELEIEIYEMIKLRMECNSRYMNAKKSSACGIYSQVSPFMEMNGFRNGSGWWIKKTDD